MFRRTDQGIKLTKGMHTLLLIIEKASEGVLWGRVEYKGDLLVDSARSLGLLEKRFKKLLKDFHQLDPDKIRFKTANDLTSVFDQTEFLKISALAQRAKVNPSLLRQYVSGVKVPTEKKVKHLESIFHDLGRELLSIKLSTPKRKKLQYH